MKKPSHSRIMLKCLETAFESKLSLARLADEELAALIRLQHSLWWHRIVASHLLSDYSDRSEELERKCRPAISQALRRLCADGGGERTALFAEALLPIPGHFPSFSKRIERLFAEYVEGSLREDSLPEARERALVAIYGLLRRFRASKKNPGYEYPIGRERAQAAIDKWMSSFDEQSGWEGLSAGTCLARLGCIEEYHVRHSLRISWEKRDAIFRRYLLDIGGYGDKDYCLAVALRGSSMDKAEDPFAEEDLAKACGLMLGSGDLATRLMAARAAVEALQAIHLEEASAMASIPETTRKRYLRAAKAGDPASMTDSELAKAAELACSVTNTLRSLEDECGFSAERLRISATARRLRAELAARGGDKMLRLARKMGLGGQMAAEPREDWAAGSREAVERIVEKALSADAQGRSDAELSELAGLLKAIHDNRDRLEPDGERLERAMERCFAPLWLRCCGGEGSPMQQFPGIKAIFECQPFGVFYSFYGQMRELEEALVEALLKAGSSHPGHALSAVEVAGSYPLRDIDGFEIPRRYKETPGMGFYRGELRRWAAELERKGCWPGLCLADAFRRIRVFQDDRLRCAEGVDYEWVIATAFNRYSREVIETGGSGVTMHPCPFEAIGLMADCYFGLANPGVTDLMPAHLIRYCAAGPEEDLHGSHRWMFYSIVLRAHLMQERLLASAPQIEYSMN